MSSTKMLEDFANKEYEHGFVTEVDQDVLPPGLDEDVIRTISARKNEPEISYFAAPKKQLESLDEVDPELLATYEKLGIPAGGAEDPRRRGGGRGVRQRLRRDHLQGQAGRSGRHLLLDLRGGAGTPGTGREHLGIGGADTDNFFATLNSAVFTDGSFVYIPKGVRCPMELSTYFRINAQNTGQFERTLIVADEGSYVSYLEGCTAPSATRTSSTPPWWSSSPSGTPRSSTRPSRTGTPATRRRRGRHLQLRHQARDLPRRPGQDQLDPGRDRIGHHLEVPVGDPQGRRLGGRVLLGGADRTGASRPTPAPR
jgi:hypothetical protein